jgi:acetoin utilization deacetylase AcuC-like enzyme
VWYADHYTLELPAGHRFPHTKYTLLREQLLRNGTLVEAQLIDPVFISEEVVLQAHTAPYIRALKTLTLPKAMERRIGLPVTERLVQRAWVSASGTYWAGYHALANGAAANLGGGTHHAFADRGEGYCLLNDVAISAGPGRAPGERNRRSASR